MVLKQCCAIEHITSVSECVSEDSFESYVSRFAIQPPKVQWLRVIAKFIIAFDSKSGGEFVSVGSDSEHELIVKPLLSKLADLIYAHQRRAETCCEGDVEQFTISFQAELQECLDDLCDDDDILAKYPDLERHAKRIFSDIWDHRTQRPWRGVTRKSG